MPEDMNGGLKMSIKFENVVLPSSEQWEAIIIGTRNPMNSWDKSDSKFVEEIDFDPSDHPCGVNLGKNDLDLMRRLAAGGPVHAKYRRMITVIVTITAPLYWWKEFDTYRVGVEKNSCSTMHKIAAKEFTLEDFSHEHLMNGNAMFIHNKGDFRCVNNIQFLMWTIDLLNANRRLYLKTKDKKYWWQMIQLLPSSYNQKRTVMMNYEVLAHIWNDRRRHKLDEWAEHPVNITKLDIQSVGLTKDGLGVRGPIETKQKYFGFCDWIKTLPYPELICGEYANKEKTTPDCFVPIPEDK